MSSIAAETRIAIRVLGRSRAYTLVAVLTLAISMGANTAIFSMADAIVKRPFPFPALERLVVLSSTIPKTGSARYLVSPADFFDWTERSSRIFARLAAYRNWDVQITGTGEPQPVRAMIVSPGFFPVFGITPIQGRFFSGENEPGAVVVSYGFWHQRMKSDPHGVGRTIELSGRAYAITGIMPKDFDFPTYTEVWAP